MEERKEQTGKDIVLIDEDFTIYANSRGFELYFQDIYLTSSTEFPRLKEEIGIHDWLPKTEIIDMEHFGYVVDSRGNLIICKISGEINSNFIVDIGGKKQLVPENHVYPDIPENRRHVKKIHYYTGKIEEARNKLFSHLDKLVTHKDALEINS